ncbi:MAG: FAD:protein FMN transferase, partial [Ilumatobacter sp.]|nr:FAD:protein FMN transferase [Ilumatobacter sp.]
MRSFRHHRLLGTVVDIRVSGTHAEAVDAAVVGEIEALQRELSVFDPTSTLERWKRGALVDPGPVVNAVLGDALDWQRRSGGAFNPATRTLTRIWQAAADVGEPPTGTALADAAARIADPPYRMV